MTLSETNETHTSYPHMTQATLQRQAIITKISEATTRTISTAVHVHNIKTTRQNLMPLKSRTNAKATMSKRQWWQTNAVLIYTVRSL